MSKIDAKIEDYKQMIADLEKQKKDEEEAYKNTIDWNMEQLDKYVEEIETKVKEWKIKKERELRTNPGNNGLNYDFYMSEESSVNRSVQYQNMQYNYVEQLKYPIILRKETNGTIQEVNIKHHHHHIFEFVYKILKHLFTSNKKMSNEYDNVISRLDKLEEENRQLKTCQVNYYDIKERLNILEHYDIKNKLDIIEDRLDRIDIVGESILSKLSDYNEIREKINLLENENKHLKEKIYDLI